MPPKSNMSEPLEYDKERNVVERLFLRLKIFRRIATRYDKLDVFFSGFIYFALIIDSMREHTLVPLGQSRPSVF